MGRSRGLTALAGLLASLAITVGIYLYTGWLFVFLVVPFVPILFSRSRTEPSIDRPPVNACPQCGFRTRDPEFEYCPRDGRRLREE